VKQDERIRIPPIHHKYVHSNRNREIGTTASRKSKLDPKVIKNQYPLTVRLGARSAGSGIV
jgi:hypothetical protein